MIDEQMSWKENLKLLVFTLLAVSIIGVFYSIGFGDNITGYVVFNDSSDCGSYVNEDSILSGDMSCNGTGIIINASNVVLDCAGYTINYSTAGVLGYGINNSGGYDNVTIKNCNIVEGNSATNFKHGIYFEGADDGTIQNNTITNNGVKGSGIYLTSSSSNISENTITTSGIYGFGIQLTSSSNSNISENIINTTQIDADAVWIYKDSDNNLFQNNNIAQSGRDGVRLDSSGSNYPENNSFTNNTFSNIADYDLNIVDAGIDGTYLIDQVITNYFIAGSGGIVYFKNSEHGEVRFLEAINGTGTNLSADVQISANLIEVDSVSNSGLNKSANLSFYNVSISGSAVPYRNSADCGGFCGNISNVGDDYFFSVTGFTTYSVGQNPCNQEITESTTLEEDLTCDGTVITIGADDIILDCAGYTINYSTAGVLGYGINNSGGYDNVTIKNCNILEGNVTTNSKHGIYFVGADDGTIENNNITISGAYGRGIYFSSTSDSNVTNNIINTSETAGHGILLVNSDSNTLLNNTITTSGGFGIQMSNSGNNTFRNEYINSTNHTGISVYSTGNDVNYFIDSEIIAPNGDDISISSEYSTNNVYFRNMSFNQSDVSFGLGGGNLHIQWYLDVYVNNSEGSDLSGVNITGWQTNGSQVFSVLTNSSGWTARQNITEYVQNSAGKSYWTNYTINASKQNYITGVSSVNLTDNTGLEFTLEGGCGQTINESTNLSYDIIGCENNYILNITEDDVVFDCGGRTIQGNGSYGVYVNGQDNVTVKNCDINLSGVGSANGVYYYNSSNGLIENNAVYVKFLLGIHIYSGLNNTIINNTAESGEYALSLYSDSHNNTVINNTFTANKYAIHLASATNNNVKDNIATANRVTLHIQGESENNLFINNNLTASDNKIIDDFPSDDNFLIYNNSYGEIMWGSPDLDITENGTLYFGSGLDITENNIFVNSSMFSGLNKSANLSFYNVSISGSAVPYRNSADCGGFCGNISNVEDDYFFSVTGFTNYSVGDYVAETEEETESTPTTTTDEGISIREPVIYEIEMGYLGFEYSGVDMGELFKIVMEEALDRLLNGGSGDTIGRVEQSLEVGDTIELNLMVMRLIELNKWVMEDGVLYVREGVLILDAIKDMVDAFSAEVIEIELNGVNENSVNVLVDDKTATIRLGESVGFDVNRDRVNEFNLKLESIVEDVVILEMVQKVPAVGLVEIIEEEEVSEEEKINVEGDGEESSSDESKKEDLTGKAYMFNQIGGEKKGVALFSYFVVLMIIVVSMLLSHGLSRVVVAIPEKKKIERELSLLLKDAPEGSGFVLKDGREIRNIEAMVFELMNMCKEEFTGYVNWSKNDIAEWIHYVFRESELAETLRNEKDKEMIAVLLYETLRNVKK